MIKLNTALFFAAFACAAPGFAQALRFDDFSNYTHTAAMAGNWERFGLAVGEIELGEEYGAGGGNVLLGPLRWEAGNNANFRRINLPVSNWTPFHQVEVVVRLETAHGLRAPSNPTILRLVLEDHAGGFWQTTAPQAKVPSIGDYSKLTFHLTESEMGPQGAFSLANLKTMRLRFENTPEAGAGQLAYIDSIHLVANLVEVPGVRIYEAVELVFEADWGHLYQVQRSTDLESWVNDGEEVSGNCQLVSRLYSTRQDLREFYRVLVRRD